MSTVAGETECPNERLFSLVISPIPFFPIERSTSEEKGWPEPRLRRGRERNHFPVDPSRKTLNPTVSQTYKYGSHQLSFNKIIHNNSSYQTTNQSNMKSFFASFSVATIGAMLLALASSPSGVDAYNGRVCYLICNGSLECPYGTELRPYPQGRSHDGCFTCCKNQWN
ncbi:hypothetical protein [Absidia glauca]|uniref:Uncharacterized protein n=1 Tax=Absidia glauca TaxID=4829 RepID=A0A168PY91_ABSGL|nr:hypothetical protein [Absidia glauca]